MQGEDNEIQLNIELTASDLYRFSMRHTYLSTSGAFGVVISLGSWVICWLQFDKLDNMARLALAIIGCLFTIVQPIMLYFKAKAQMIKNKNIKDSLHYILGQEEITVAQGDQEGSVRWQEVRRKVQTKKAVYLYMSPVRAFIFPADQCDGKFDQVCELIDDRMKQAEDGSDVE